MIKNKQKTNFCMTTKNVRNENYEQNLMHFYDNNQHIKKSENDINKFNLPYQKNFNYNRNVKKFLNIQNENNLETNFIYDQSINKIMSLRRKNKQATLPKRMRIENTINNYETQNNFINERIIRSNLFNRANEKINHLIKTKILDHSLDLFSQEYFNYNQVFAGPIINIFYKFVPFTLITAHVYLGRYLSNMKLYKTIKFNFWHIFVICVLLASKYWHDDFVTNDIIANNTDMSIKDVSELEYHILNVLDYDLDIKNSEICENIKKIGMIDFQSNNQTFRNNNYTNYDLENKRCKSYAYR
ncbi:Cyclin Y [Gurleya vavrai]